MFYCHLHPPYSKKRVTYSLFALTSPRFFKELVVVGGVVVTAVDPTEYTMAIIE